MISDRINAVRTSIKQVSESKRNEDKQKEETKKNNAFFDAYGTLVTAVRSVQTGSEKAGYAVSENTKGEIKAIFDDVKVIFDKKYVSNPYEISKKIDSLNFLLKTEWDEFSKSRLGIKSSIELMKLISNNSALSGIIIELNAIKEWPVTEASMSRYSKAYSRATEAIKEYNFSDEVSEFLKKVQKKKATFRDLTPEVQKWIVEEQLEDKIGLAIIS